MPSSKRVYICKIHKNPTLLPWSVFFGMFVAVWASFWRFVRLHRRIWCSSSTLIGLVAQIWASPHWVMLLSSASILFLSPPSVRTQSSGLVLRLSTVSWPTSLLRPPSYANRWLSYTICCVVLPWCTTTTSMLFAYLSTLCNTSCWRFKTVLKFTASIRVT
jgi:hypothetical protein